MARTTDRTESFSDGVFAVAATLLVLNLGVLLSVTFTATNAWSARRRLWRPGISSEEMSRQLRRAPVGLLLYSAAVGLAFVNAVMSLLFCALSAVYYTIPSRV